MLTRTAVLILLVTASAGLAQETEYERILMPISLPEIDGAHGSRWVTEHFLRNDGEAAVDVIREDCAMGPACLNSIPPGTTFRAEPSPTRGFLWIDVARSGVGGMYFSTIVRDISRSAEPWGTVIPTIREAQFRRDRVQLLNVPADPGFRRNLRAYLILDPDPSGPDLDVTVRIFDMESELAGAEGEEGRPTALLGEKVYTLHPTRFGTPADAFTVPCLECDIPGLLSGQRLRVEIERTRGTGARLWALLTATNNETQHVTIFTPD